MTCLVQVVVVQVLPGVGVDQSCVESEKPIDVTSLVEAPFPSRAVEAIEFDNIGEQ